MAIKIVNPDSEFDHLFMQELLINQARFFHQTDNPKYTVSLAWERYKVEQDGSITYDHNYVDTYYSEDFHGDAIAEYMAGSTEKVNSLSANQAVVAKIIQDNTTMILEVI